MRTTHVQPTAIRAAFENIRVDKGAYTKEGAIIGAKIHESIQGKAGIANELDWNAKLSMKTAASLDAPNYNPMKTVTKADGTKEQVSCFRERAWNTGTFNKMCS